MVDLGLDARATKSEPHYNCGRYDTNADGAVTVEEFAAGRLSERQFQANDANHDGKLTREEWIAKHGNDDLFDA